MGSLFACRGHMSFLECFLWKCIVDLLVAFAVGSRFVHVCVCARVRVHVHSCAHTPTNEDSPCHVQRLIDNMARLAGKWQVF